MAGIRTTQTSEDKTCAVLVAISMFSKLAILLFAGFYSYYA